MNKYFFVVGNLIWLRMESNSGFASRTPMYMMLSKGGGLYPDAIMSEPELVAAFPDGEFFKNIQFSN